MKFTKAILFIFCVVFLFSCEEESSGTGTTTRYFTLANVELNGHIAVRIDYYVYMDDGDEYEVKIGNSVSGTDAIPLQKISAPNDASKYIAVAFQDGSSIITRTRSVYYWPLANYFCAIGDTIMGFETLDSLNEYLESKGIAARDESTMIEIDYTDHQTKWKDSSSSSSADYDAFAGGDCKSYADTYSEVYSNNDVSNMSSACTNLYTCLVNNSTGSYVSYYQNYLDSCP